MPQLHDTRFGILEYESEDVFQFEDGLLGFAHCRRFVFVEPHAQKAFRWMQSLEEPAVAFLVVDPPEFAPGYGLELNDGDADALHIGPETATALLTTATIPAGRPREMTINLAGPIVVNLEARIGRQLVVDDELCPVRYAVFASEAPTAKAA